MKKNQRNKKVLVTALSGLLIVALTVMATLAYLQSTTETLTNTFTVGKVGITLNDAYGKFEEPTKLIPGSTYERAPEVTVTKSSEDAYVRMLVTVTVAGDANIAEKALKDAEFIKHTTGSESGNDLANLGLNSDVFTGLSDEWKLQPEATFNENTVIFEYRHQGTETVGKPGIVEKTKTENANFPLNKLFSSIKVPTSLDKAEMDPLAGLQISIVAEAIQAENFTDADKAWSAFDNQ